MTELQQRMGLTDDQTQALANDINSMAGTVAGGVYTHEQLADALLSVSREGRSAGDSLTIMQNAATLATAEHIDLNQATQQLGTTLDALGGSAADSAHIMEVLYLAHKDTVAGSEDLSQALITTAQTAKTFGMSIDENAASLLVLEQHGGQTRGLQTAMEALLSPTKATKTAFDDLGVSLVDGQGKMRPILDVLADVNARGQALGLTDAQIGQVMNDAFGAQGGKAINILRDNLDQVAQKTKEFQAGAGAAEAAAIAMADTPAARFQAFQARVTDLKEGIGDKLVPALLATLDAAEKLGDLYEKHKTLVDALAIAIGAGAVALGLYAIATNAATLAFGGALAAQAAFALGAAVLDVALAPLTLTILAIAAAAGVLYLAWTNDWGGIREITEDVGNFIMGKLGTMADFLRDTLGAIVQTWVIEFQAIHDVVAAVFKTIADLLAATFLTIKDIFTGNFSDLKAVWSAFGNDIAAIWTNLGHQLLELAGRWVNDIMNSVIGGLDDLENFFFDLGVRIPQSIIRGVGDLGGKLWDAVKNGLHNTADNIGQWAKGQLGLSPTLEELGMDVPASLGRGVQAGGDALTESIKNVMHDAAAAVGDSLQGMTQEAQQWAQHLNLESQGKEAAQLGEAGYQPSPSTWSKNLGTLPNGMRIESTGYGSYNVWDPNNPQRSAGGYATGIESALHLPPGTLKSAVSGAGLPYYADGGYVDRPTLAVVGEGGPEAILPMTKLTAIVQSIVQSLGSAVGGPTINIQTLNVQDGADLKRRFAQWGVRLR
jgi:TP901 family phage tail tape measure protein